MQFKEGFTKVKGNISIEKLKKDICVCGFVIVLWLFVLRQLSAMMAIVPYFSSIAIVYGDIILWTGILLLGSILLCNRPTIWEIIACIWAVITVYISDNTMMLILMFLMITSHKISIEKRDIVKAWMIPISIIMILSIVLYPILHAQGNPVAIDYCGVRWNFFFGHPNGFGLIFTFWILGIVYLIKEKVPLWGVELLFLVASAFLLLAPQSKTAAAVMVLGGLLFFLEKYSWKTCNIMLYLVPIGCILVTIILTAVYYLGIIPCNQSVLYPTFSMRFQDAAINLKECPLNLFGQKVYHLGQDIELYGVLRRDVSMDNSIIAALIYFGVLLGTFLVGLIVVNIYNQARAEDKRHRIQAILLTLTFVMGMMEWPAWYGTIGFPLLFIGDWIKKDDKKKSEIT